MDTNDFKEMGARISLHGLGFVQVKLHARQRLHVWHPSLPRRRCFEHSAIHDHRFGFRSTVLVGGQMDDLYAAYEPGVNGVDPRLEPSHVAYLHEGDRTEFGNRPWLPRERLWVAHVRRRIVAAGETYHVDPYVFHASTPMGDGMSATLMTKVSEGPRGARSLCAVGVEPDVDFDRHQLSDDDLWDAVHEVLGHDARVHT